MLWWIAVLNMLVAFASTGFGVAALIKPALILPRADQTTPSRGYPAMYAARAIPLGLAVAVVVWFPPTPGLLVVVLGVAILAQIGDVAIGAVYRRAGMTVGAIFAVLCHAAALLTSL